MKVNGLTIKPMEWEYIATSTELYMKETGRETCKMDTVKSLGQMVANFVEIILMETNMVTEYTNGMTIVFIQEIGYRVKFRV